VTELANHQLNFYKAEDVFGVMKPNNIRPDLDELFKHQVEIGWISRPQYNNMKRRGSSSVWNDTQEFESPRASKIKSSQQYEDEMSKSNPRKLMNKSGQMMRSPQFPKMTRKEYKHGFTEPNINGTIPEEEEESISEIKYNT